MKTKTMKNENIVHVVEEYDIPRYEMQVRDDCSDECDMVIEEIKDCCKIWVKSLYYSNLANVDLDEHEVFKGDALAGYQKFLDHEFGKGKYEAFVLGAYIHSGTSFSISKTGDHRCRFDSGILGFIGVPKGTNVDEIAEELTAAWEGEYEGYDIYDNLTDEYIDSICDYDYKNIKKWKEEARSKYNIQ